MYFTIITASVLHGSTSSVVKHTASSYCNCFSEPVCSFGCGEKGFTRKEIYIVNRHCFTPVFLGNT